MNRNILFATAALTLLVPGFANAQDSNNQDSMTTEQSAGGAENSAAMETMMVTDAETFMMMAAQSDMFEIESSELALEKAQSDKVKQFAQQMITDHTANTAKLMETVEAGDGQMQKPAELDAAHQAMLDPLEDASDDQFDAAYIDAQVMAHQQAVALFTSYAENGDNETLKGFAAEQLPVLQMHNEMVQKMDQSM